MHIANMFHNSRDNKRMVVHVAQKILQNSMSEHKVFEISNHIGGVDVRETAHAHVAIEYCIFIVRQFEISCPYAVHSTLYFSLQANGRINFADYGKQRSQIPQNE